MKWVKPTQELLDMFDDLIPFAPGTEKRKMFGYPCLFVNNNVFMGLFYENIFLRLSEQDRETFLQIEQAKRFEPTPGRIMKEYAIVPSWMTKDMTLLQEWIKKSLTYAFSLPPKIKKKKK